MCKILNDEIPENIIIKYRLFIIIHNRHLMLARIGNTYTYLSHPNSRENESIL